MHELTRRKKVGIETVQPARFGETGG
jgi:hypothetical protein